MNKAVLLLVILGSIGVCLIGISKNQNKMEKQKVSFSTSKMSDVVNEINALEQQVDALFLKETPAFFVEGVQEADIRELSNQLAKINVTKSHVINVAKLNELNQKKYYLDEKIERALNKMRLQREIESLFLVDAIQWVDLKENYTVHETVDDEMIQELRVAIVTMMEETDWYIAADKLLRISEEQSLFYSGVKQEVENLEKDATKEADVAQLLLQANQIQNPTWRNALITRIEKLNK